MDQLHSRSSDIAFAVELLRVFLSCSRSYATSRDALAESGSSAQAVGPPSLAEDIDLVSTAPELTAATPMFSLYGASAVPVDIPEDAMDGDVELSSLGDVARTMESGR